MPDSATPLTTDERTGLIAKGVETRGDLREREETVIHEARRWALARRRPIDRILTETFLCRLHYQMFRGIWVWAGQYREQADDPDHELLEAHFQSALTDARSWIAERTWPRRGLAARFHHRLASLQPFPRGNGRWSRLATDVLVYAMREPIPTWGSSDPGRSPTEGYLHAIKQADQGEYRALALFMWS